MASIFNIQIKNYKSFLGRDGHGFNANLYLNGKKIATCLDSGDGGMMDVYFVNNEVRQETEKIIQSYYEKNPKIIGYDGIVCEFVEELIHLYELEKLYKKSSKSGRSVVVDITYNGRMTPILDYNFEKQDFQISCNNWNAQIEKAMIDKYKPVEYKAYISLNDFDIKE